MPQKFTIVTYFDVLGLAKVVFEYIYTSIHEIDGQDGTADLQRSMKLSLEKKTSPHKRKRFPSKHIQSPSE